MFFKKVSIACSTSCLHVLFALYLTENTTEMAKKHANFGKLYIINHSVLAMELYKLFNSSSVSIMY